MPTFLIPKKQNYSAFITQYKIDLIVLCITSVGGVIFMAYELLRKQRIGPKKQK